MKAQIPKGLFDILPYGSKEKWRLVSYWQYIESVIHEITSQFGFVEIRTPVFELAEVFNRGVGTSSDIVSKEMYVFQDKGNRCLALRPEGTSGVLRAFAEKNFSQLAKVHKLYYIAPMFRYERPQAGRYRQHHQFGVEAIGVLDPMMDVEIIDLLWQFLQRLDLKGLTLEINSLGDVSCREKYKLALIHYLSTHKNSLSSDSQVRLQKNPLRILDSKDPQDKEIVEKAPSILDFLSDETLSHFKKVCAYLEAIEIPYCVNPKIVRGLDYYNRTVFEISSNALGAQTALGGGGRYDNFTQIFGIEPLPGVGFGCGIERIIQAILAQNTAVPTPSHPFIYFIGLEEKSRNKAFSIVSTLRKHHIPAVMDFKEKKLSHALQRAHSSSSTYCVVIGEDELTTNTIKLKNMKSREEKTLALDSLVNTIIQMWK